MNDPTIARALFVLRATLGIFLLQWGIEKFVVPANTPAIWGYFYGISVPEWSAYAFGAAEIALAVCYFLGLFPAIAYGAGVLLHAVTVIVSWQQLLNPWADPASHLFVASIPTLGAFIALFLLRARDRPMIGAPSQT
jgi:putative oxidoreductase